MINQEEELFFDDPPRTISNKMITTRITTPIITMIVVGLMTMPEVGWAAVCGWEPPEMVTPPSLLGEALAWKEKAPQADRSNTAITRMELTANILEIVCFLKLISIYPLCGFKLYFNIRALRQFFRK